MADLSLFDPWMLASVPTTASLILQCPTVFAYVGPDQILPLASVLSAIAGIALVFWNRLVSFVGLCWSIVTGRGRPSRTPREPAPEAETAD